MLEKTVVSIALLLWMMFQMLWIDVFIIRGHSYSKQWHKKIIKRLKKANNDKNNNQYLSVIIIIGFF